MSHYRVEASVQLYAWLEPAVADLTTGLQIFEAPVASNNAAMSRRCGLSTFLDVSSLQFSQRRDNKTSFYAAAYKYYTSHIADASVHHLALIRRGILPPAPKSPPSRGCLVLCGLLDMGCVFVFQS